MEPITRYNSYVYDPKKRRNTFDPTELANRKEIDKRFNNRVKKEAPVGRSALTPEERKRRRSASQKRSWAKRRHIANEQRRLRYEIAKREREEAQRGTD